MSQRIQNDLKGVEIKPQESLNFKLGAQNQNPENPMLYFPFYFLFLFVFSDEQKASQEESVLVGIFIWFVVGFFILRWSEHDNQDMKHLQIKLLLYFISSGL